MKILGRQIGFGKRRSDQPSSLEAVLPRLRSMRENGAWQPNTSPTALEERKIRVLDARKSIQYQPAPYEPVSELSPRQWLRVRFRLVFAVVLVCAAILWAFAMWLPGKVGPAFRFVLSDAPAFLSERLVLGKAYEALAEVGLETNDWKPIAQFTQSSGRIAPDGTIEFYMVRPRVGDSNSGIIVFLKAGGWSSSQWVTLQLQSNQLWYVISTGPDYRIYQPQGVITNGL